MLVKIDEFEVEKAEIAELISDYHKLGYEVGVISKPVVKMSLSEMTGSTVPVECIERKLIIYKKEVK